MNQITRINKNTQSRILLWISALCLSLTSCRTDIDFREVSHNYSNVQKEIRSKFTDLYQAPSISHSWLNIKESSVKVSFSEDIQDSISTLRIYTTDPRQERTDCYILAENNKAKSEKEVEIFYDHPVGLRYVYLAAISGNNSYVSRIETDSYEAVISSRHLYNDTLSDRSMEYLLCYETILQKDSAYVDFDYNDAVFGLQYVRGRKFANVNLLAVGCNELVRLDFVRRNSLKLDNTKEVIFEDCHTIFGLPPYYSYLEKKDIYDEINSGKYNFDIIPSYELDIESFLGVSVKDLIPRFFVSFGKDNKKTKANTYYIENENGSDMPTGICIPQPTWKWPNEGVEIGKACGLFKDWVNDCWANPFWYDATWLIANNREKEDPSMNCEYGVELTLENNHITPEQFLSYIDYSCILAIKVSNVTVPGSLRLCKYENTPILFVKDLNISKEGIYEVALSPLDFYKIMELETTGQAGLQLIYEGFEIEGVYIR